MKVPDRKGYFGEFGGKFIPETLSNALLELQEAYSKARKSREFRKTLSHYLGDYAGRPTPLYFARKLSSKLKLKIYLKREDLLHTGAHKINNTLGQVLLARYMGKKELLRKPVPANTVWLQQRQRRYSALNAKYIWAMLI